MDPSSRRHVTFGAPGMADDRMRMLLDGTRDFSIIMLGPHGMVLTWNTGAQWITGFRSEEIIGQHVSVLYAPEALAERHPDEALEIARVEGRYAEEGWRVRNDGSRFWADVVITPLRDRTGRLRGFAKVTRDLSERMRGDELLAVLDGASEAIIGTDSEGSITFLNTAGERLFGYSHGEAVGRPMSDLVPSGRHAAPKAPVETIPVARAEVPVARCGEAAVERDAGEPLLERDLVAVRKDGSTFPVDLSLSAVLTPRGRVVTATVRDVSERHRADHARRLSEEWLRVFFQESPVGQFEAALDHMIIMANERLEGLLGYDAGELTGRSLLDLLDLRDRRRAVIELDRLQVGLTPRVEADLMLIGKDGAPVRACVSARIMHSAEGAVQGVAGSVTPFSAQR